jgi:hypothetical protein
MHRRHESFSITLHEGRLVRVVVVRLYRGVDVGGQLWFGLDAVPWLVEALERCLDTLQGSETTIGPDSLRVKEKGHEFDPKVGIGNVRGGSVQRAGRYFVSMREATAGDFTAHLRGLTEQGETRHDPHPAGLKPSLPASSSSLTGASILSHVLSLSKDDREAMYRRMRSQTPGARVEDARLDGETRALRYGLRPTQHAGRGCSSLTLRSLDGRG